MIDTQAIRSKILDLAMRGQLTKQLPEDGTGEELFQKIQAEKQALMGRSDGRKLLKEGRKIYSRFSLGTIAETHEDPYAQAAYIYSLIESEE